MITILTDHAVLSAEDCRAIRDRLFALERRWIDRTADAERGFCTLGAAADLDFHMRTLDSPGYYRRAAAYNPLIADAFGDVLDAVRAKLADILAAPARWSDRCALPGFRIFRRDAIRNAGFPGAHFDCQYAGLDLGGELDPDPPVSFTLAIALPKSGGGLEVWNLTSDEFRRRYDLGLISSIREYQYRAVSRIHPYKVGTMTVHHDLVLHQIAPTTPVDDDDEWITLQGHAIKTRGEWVIYG